MIGWAVLFDAAKRPGWGFLYLARWASESVNNLLPVAQIGGEVVRARLAAQAGTRTDYAAATVVIDFTLGLFALVIFAVLGLALLILVGGTGDQIIAIAIGIAIFAGLAVGFVLAQRAGLFRHAGNLGAWLARLTKRDHLVPGLEGAYQLDSTLDEIYGRYGRLAACSAFRLLSFVLGAAEVWLGLYFLGHPVGITEAIIIQSMTMAVRGAAFAIPGGLGAQEGGFLVIGAMLGLPAATMLAMALLKRVREIAFGLPRSRDLVARRAPFRGPGRGRQRMTLAGCRQWPLSSAPVDVFSSRSGKIKDLPQLRCLQMNRANHTLRSLTPSCRGEATC